MFDRSIFTRVGRPLSALVIAGVSLALASCGGGSDNGSRNPTTPTRQAAALSVTTFTASATQNATENLYEIRVTVRESGGQTGATLSTIELSLSDSSGTYGSATIDDGWVATTVAAGSSANSRLIRLRDANDGRRLATRITARISYTDDTQVNGALTASADIAQPAAPPPQSTFTVAGIVSDDSLETPISAATVTILDGANAGRSSTTDGNGYYSIPTLRPGSFTIRATKAGYNPGDRGLTLSADTRIDLRMRSIAPAPAPPAPPSPPPADSMTCSNAPATAACGKPTARCNDGTYSCSQNHSGTCSSHGGVSCWICPGVLCKAVWSDAAIEWR